MLQNWSKFHSKLFNVVSLLLRHLIPFSKIFHLISEVLPLVVLNLSLWLYLSILRMQISISEIFEYSSIIPYRSVVYESYSEACETELWQQNIASECVWCSVHNMANTNCIMDYSCCYYYYCCCAFLLLPLRCARLARTRSYTSELYMPSIFEYWCLRHIHDKNSKLKSNGVPPPFSKDS